MNGKRRGFTLLELTIVMAVTAILTAGIVTLCASVKGISQRTEQVNKSISDVSTLRRETESWLSFFDTAQWSVNVQDGKLVATNADDSTVKYAFRLENGTDGNSKIVAQYPADEGGNKQTQLSFVTTLTFSLVNIGQTVTVPNIGGEGSTNVTLPTDGSGRLFKCQVVQATDVTADSQINQTSFLVVTRGNAV